MSKLLYEDLTYRIRGSYFDVYNALGHDYPESFYEKALYFDIRNKGLKCVRQEDHQISYKEQLVGRHTLDLVVDDTVIIELKVVETEPGFRGNTANTATKSATLETGLIIQVPLFVDEGNTIKVDTRSGNYLERVN